MRGSSALRSNTVRPVSHATATPTRTITTPMTTKRFCELGSFGSMARPIVALHDLEQDEGGREPGGERQEAAGARVVGSELEHAPARPEAGHQADDARHRGEEGGRRAGAARDRQDRPDEVGQDAGQGAGPRSGQRADEHRPDRIEVDRETQGEDDRADRDVDRDGDRHQAEDGRREVARSATDDGEQNGADDQCDEVDDLDGRDAVGGLALRADRQPVQVHPVLLVPHRDDVAAALVV